jgi:hypothetical protein
LKLWLKGTSQQSSLLDTVQASVKTKSSLLALVLSQLWQVHTGTTDLQHFAVIDVNNTFDTLRPRSQVNEAAFSMVHSDAAQVKLH